MGWSFEYYVRLGRPLTPEETRDLRDWRARTHLKVREPGVDHLKQWRGLVPEETLETAKRFERNERPRIRDCSFFGRADKPSDKQLARYILELQELQRLLPFAEIQLTDPDGEELIHPMEVPAPTLARLARPAPRRKAERRPPLPELTPEELSEAAQAEPAEDREVEAALARARVALEVWKRRKADS